MNRGKRKLLKALKEIKKIKEGKLKAKPLSELLKKLK